MIGSDRRDPTRARDRSREYSCQFFSSPSLSVKQSISIHIHLSVSLSLSPLCRYEDRPRWRRNGRRRRLSWELTRRDGGAEARLRRSLALPGETIRRGGGRPQNNGCTVRIFASLGWGEREREHREREKQLSFLLSFPPTLSCQEGGNLSLSLSINLKEENGESARSLSEFRILSWVFNDLVFKNILNIR